MVNIISVTEQYGTLRCLTHTAIIVFAHHMLAAVCLFALQGAVWVIDNVFT